MSIASESPLREALYSGEIDRAERQAIREAFGQRRRTTPCGPAYESPTVIFEDFYSQAEPWQKENPE